MMISVLCAKWTVRPRIATCVPRFSTKMWPTTKIHAVCASEKFALKFHLSAGNRHDAPEDRKLIESLGSRVISYLLMGRAYEDDETRALALEHWGISVVPPKKGRRQSNNCIDAFIDMNGGVKEHS